MTKLIKLSDLQEPKKQLKPIEFVEFCINPEWHPAISTPRDYKTVIHLGNDDGWDYFIAYHYIYNVVHFRGHLNDGVIE